MSYQDTPPQHILDDINKANIPAVFEPVMNARSRASAIQNARQSLSKLTVQLQKQRDTILSRMSRSKEADEEIKRVLAPYNLLQNLILELEGQIKNLEDRLAAGKLLPPGFEIGTVIFGSEETGEWFLGDVDDSERWAYGQQVKKRRDEFWKERQPLSKQLKEAKSQLNSLQTKLKKESRKYKKRRSRGYILRRLLILLVLGGALAGVGAYVYLTLGNQVGIAGIGLGVVLLIYLPMAYLRWKRGLNALQQEIADGKQSLQHLKQYGKKLQLQFLPIDDTFNELHAEYKELRATFG